MPEEQNNMLSRQTEKKVNKWKIFRTESLIYKEVNSGIQSMVDLISVKARQGLVIHLQMNTQQFLQLTDEQYMKVFKNTVNWNKTPIKILVNKYYHLRPEKDKNHWRKEEELLKLTKSAHA